MPTSKTRKPATTSTRKPGRKPGAKNFGFKTGPTGARAGTGADIPFYLSDDDPVEYHVRGQADEEGLGLIAAEIARAEAVEDLSKLGEGLIDVLNNLFTTSTVNKLKRKIVDPDDEFRLSDLFQVIEWAVEQLAERPTTPSRI